MESSMYVDSDSGRGSGSTCSNFITPCKIMLSRLSNVPLSSSSKRSLFQEDKKLNKNMETTSDVDSDLGPMSPLALTDPSSCESSPGRHFVSPFATPEKSPKVKNSRWSQLSFTANQTPTAISPFSALKRITRAARSTPRKNLFMIRDTCLN